MWIIIILLLNIYLAWRMSKTEADPDFAMFNMAGFTGSWYGRDFIDCKSPLVHLYFYALRLIAGKSVTRVKLLHHFLVGMPGLIYALITNDYKTGLVFTLLVNCGWLWTFTGNVGQVPAGLILLALGINNPYAAATFLVIATLYEPKLLLVTVFLTITGKLYAPMAIWAGVGALLYVYLVKYHKQVWEWIWYSNVTIPARMNESRRKARAYGWSPWFTSQSVIYILPWIIAGAINKPDILFWMPVIIFMIFTALGYVIRPHHWIPIIPWIAIAVPPEWALILIAVDFISSGFYLGDIWERHYRLFINIIRECQAVGQYLKENMNENDTLWVNGMNTEVYLYAEKPAMYGAIEQIEIREVATERYKDYASRWMNNPPDWVVETPSPGAVKFNHHGYQHIMHGQSTVVWRCIR